MRRFWLAEPDRRLTREEWKTLIAGFLLFLVIGLWLIANGEVINHNWGWQ